MPTIERRIRQVQRVRSAPFEEHFWPIAVALVATAGLGAGAISAVVRGPWMWGLLLAAPLFLVLALIGAYHVRQRFLRRSVQFAALISLAMHLLAIILSAALDIFSGTKPPPVVERAPHREAPTMIVSQRDPHPIWEQINARPTPDLQIEFAREPAQTQTIHRTQPVELAPAQPTLESQSLTRRSAPPAAARHDVSLSQRQRSDARPIAPATHADAIPVPHREVTTAAAADPSPRVAESAHRAVAPPTSPAEFSDPRLTDAALQRSLAAAAPAQAPRRETAREMAFPTDAPPSAPMRNPNWTLPQAAAATSTHPRTLPPAAQPNATAQVGELPAQRSVAVERPQPHFEPSTMAARQPQPDHPIARQELRSDSATEATSIPATRSNAARTLEARKPTAAQAVAPSAFSSADPQPQVTTQVADTTSTRGESGGAHATTLANLQSVTTPSAGMATTPSDSSVARRSESRADPQPMLTAIERPQQSGRTTGNQSPQSAWAANVEHPAPLSGQINPAPSSTESAAANLEVTARRTGRERPSEQGAGVVELGPVKLVADQQAQRHSGGGDPLPSAMSIEPVPLRSRSTSGVQTSPTLPGPAQQEIAVGPTETPQPSEGRGSEGLQRAVESSHPGQSASGAGEETLLDHLPGSIAKDAGSAKGDARRVEANWQPGTNDSRAESADPLGGLQPNRVSRGPQVDALSRMPDGAMASESSPPNGRPSRSDGVAAGENAGRASATLPLDIAALPGTPGLSHDPRPGLGTAARSATRDADVSPIGENARFRRRDTGGEPAVPADANVATEAFRVRTEDRSASGPSTELAIELGLEFLARYQRADGSWALEDFDRQDPRHGQIMNSDVAATGLALLAFQGAGYTHREFKYAEQLSRAVQWLLRQQQANGLLFVPRDPQRSLYCQMYSHAIATLALTEAYGMTQDPSLREPIERALAYATATQDRQYGGWRYVEPQRAVGERSDTSVTGWMMMALQSARLAEFRVAPAVWEGIDRWLSVSRDVDQEWLYRYNPFAEDGPNVQRVHGRQASPTMTSVGLLMRLYTGWDRRDERLTAGGYYLLQHLPSDRSIAERDTYYWYYATQVMRHLGGESWDQWNGRLHPLLVNSQVKSGEWAGSWDPFAPIPDRWAHAGGRLYVTTMNLLSLEVNYRLLPLYERSTR